MSDALQTRHWEMSVTLREPSPSVAKQALQAIFKLMGPDLPAIAAKLGIPMMNPMGPDEYARRHAAIKQFVLDNPWDTPIPENFGRSPFIFPTGQTTPITSNDKLLAGSFCVSPIPDLPSQNKKRV